METCDQRWTKSERRDGDRSPSGVMEIGGQRFDQWQLEEWRSEIGLEAIRGDSKMSYSIKGERFDWRWSKSKAVIRITKIRFRSLETAIRGTKIEVTIRRTDIEKWSPDSKNEDWRSKSKVAIQFGTKNSGDRPDRWLRSFQLTPTLETSPSGES